jgi:hypothetical protein
MGSCTERDRLIVEWYEAVVKLASHISQLRMGRENANEYQTTDLARQAAEKSATLSTAHRAEHGC